MYYSTIYMYYSTVYMYYSTVYIYVLKCCIYVLQCCIYVLQYCIYVLKCCICVLQEHRLIYVQAEEVPPASSRLAESNESNGRDEFYIELEPEPIKAALISQDIMEILDTYTPGTIGTVGELFSYVRLAFNLLYCIIFLP